MCHIVDEVILYLCQLLLAEDDVDSKDECHKQYKRKMSDGIINLTELNM